MKSLSQFLAKKNLNKKNDIDEKTIFFIFEKLIQREYGNVGRISIKPRHYAKGKIFLEAKSSNWAQEIWLNRDELVNKINSELGSDQIKEIKI